MRAYVICGTSTVITLPLVFASARRGWRRLIDYRRASAFKRILDAAPRSSSSLNHYLNDARLVIDVGKTVFRGKKGGKCRLCIISYLF